MRQIRRNVFETNSSSSHSISIRKENVTLDCISIAERGVNEYGWLSAIGTMHFYDHELEFGRSPFSVLVTFYDKLRFAIASLADDPNDREEIEAVMYEVIPGLKTIQYPTHYDYSSQSRHTYYGSIDHESCGLLKAFLDKHKLSIRDFLLNTKYVVWIDGDEYNVKESLFTHGLVSKDLFETI